MENQELHLARGDAAKSLLKTEAFQAVTNELVNAYMGQIVQSEPAQTAERERCYAGIKAVQDLVGLLNTWIGVAVQARMQAEAQADESTDD